MSPAILNGNVNIAAYSGVSEFVNRVNSLQILQLESKVETKGLSVFGIEPNTLDSKDY